MTIWTVLSFFVVYVLTEPYLTNRFNNKYADMFYGLFFLVIIAALFVYSAEYDGLMGLATVSAIMTINPLFEIKKLNRTKEDK